MPDQGHKTMRIVEVVADKMEKEETMEEEEEDSQMQGRDLEEEEVTEEKKAQEDGTKTKTMEIEVVMVMVMGMAIEIEETEIVMIEVIGTEIAVTPILVEEVVYLKVITETKMVTEDPEDLQNASNATNKVTFQKIVLGRAKCLQDLINNPKEEEDLRISANHLPRCQKNNFVITDSCLQIYF